MLKNYLVVALRGLRRHRGYAAINVLGLAVGMACGTLILLHVQDELRYDRHHAHAGRTYRIVKDFVNVDGSRLPDATTPAALAPAMLREIPEVEQATRLFPTWGQQVLLSADDERAFYERDFLRVDSTFFDVFTVPFLRGDARTAFARPRSIVVTERAARKYFGDADPVGRTLTFQDAFDLTVTGVVEDPPPQSHFTYDFLVSIRSLGENFEGAYGLDEDWGQYNYYTYVRLRPGADIAAVEAKLEPLVRASDEDNLDDFYAQPLAGLGGIHLASDLKWELAPNGDRRSLYVFLTVALGVIAIACVNYVNLTTARSAQRAKEVGVRKALGAARGRLVAQFLAESVLMTALAALLAVGLLEAALPVFNAVTGKSLSLLGGGALAPGLLAAVALVCGVGAGTYPALYLAGFSPLAAFRGRAGGGARGLRLRQGLVVFQFVVSVVLLVGVLVIREQMAYVRGAGLGFDDAGVLVVRNAGGLPGRGAGFEAALARVPGVEAAAAADGMVGGQNWTNTLRPRGAEGDGHLVNFISVGYDFLDALDLELVEGRAFSPAHPSDSADAIILNETAVRDLGVPGPVLGQELVWAEEEDTTYYVRVVGVVRDFHFTSLRSEIKPYAFVYTPGRGGEYAVEFAPGADVAATRAAVEHAWAAEAPGRPFDAYFLDESIAGLYRAERAFGRVFSALTLLGLLVACLGLFGLAAFAAERRTKEVGVRKVLGASVPSVVGLLTRDFLKLVGVAFVVAVPVAWLAMSRWLEGFAYRVDLGPGVFLLAGLLTAAIAVATVSYQALRAATTDPVKALRYE